MNKTLARISTVTATSVGFLVLAAGSAFAAPDPSPNLPTGVEAKFDNILGVGMALVIIACVGGVFLSAGKLAIAMRHGEAGEAAKGLVAVMVACVLVGSASGLVAYLV